MPPKKTWQNNVAQRIVVDGTLVSVHPLCQHGTRSGYSRYGCRCDLCSEAEKQYRAQLKAEKISEQLHGTIAGYNRGCRQPCCRTAQQEYDAKRGSSAARLGRDKPTAPQLPRHTAASAAPWLQYDRAARRWISTRPGLQHGTTTAHRNYRCRCQPCMDAARDSRAEWREQARERPIPGHVHGTTNGYQNYGCRCDDCRIATRPKE